jgi:hypothetical protein
LSAEDIAAYLDGRLAPEDRARVEAVLAANPEARAELVEASRLIETMPDARKHTKRPWVLVSVAAAAAVFLFGIGPSLLRKPTTLPVATERQTTTTDNQEIRVVSPSEGAEVKPSQSRFTWNSVDGATYQITITDAEGRAVWQSTTSDTTASIPAGIKLREHATYYWNVDALAANGTSTTTGVHSFTTIAK